MPSASEPKAKLPAHLPTVAGSWACRGRSRGPETRCIKGQGACGPILSLITAWPIRSAYFAVCSAMAWRRSVIRGPHHG